MKVSLLTPKRLDFYPELLIKQKLRLSYILVGDFGLMAI